MLRIVTWSISLLLLLGLLFLALDIKNAYKLIPINSSAELVFPPFSGWREFQAPSERFKVFLPAPPQYAKESVPIPDTDKKRQYEMYVSEKLNGPVFMISLITYPKEVDISNVEKMLQAIVDEMMKSKADNKLKKTENVIFQGHPAIKFNIVNANFNVEGMALMVDRTIYLLSYIAQNSEFTADDYQYFINTFKLLPKSQTSSLSE
jgi:hypothetical protein